MTPEELRALAESCAQPDPEPSTASAVQVLRPRAIRAPWTQAALTEDEIEEALAQCGL